MPDVETKLLLFTEARLDCNDVKAEVQVLGNGVVHHLQEGGIKESPCSDSGHLVDPLEKGTASLCCG